MKYYTDIFYKVNNFENFYEGYIEAKKGKDFKPEIMHVGENIADIIHQMIFELNTGEWRPQEYHNFETRKETKRRIINAPTFRDRIFHHALCRVIAPMFENKFIYDSYANRKGKGQHRAAYRIQSFLRKAEATGKRVHAIKGDCENFYGSVDHGILKSILGKTLRDKMLMEAIGFLIDGYDEEPGKGLPKGALTSGVFGNTYLNELDHYVKETLRVKYYVRFNDDFVIVDTDKERLKEVLAAIATFLRERLHINLNRKTSLFPASHGIDFVGYRVFTHKILPRKRNIRAAKLRFKHISWLYKRGKADVEYAKSRVSSFIGYTSHCKAKQTTCSTLRWLVLQRGHQDNGN